MMLRPFFAGVTVLAAAVACATGPEAPEIDPGYADSIIGGPAAGLRQRVTVVPGRLAAGDTILVRSVLSNDGFVAVHQTSTICGLHLDGTLTFRDPFGRCGGYSMTGDLAPGDSVVDTRSVVVTSPPGSWNLEVRHLLEPSTWISVPVEVVGP